MALKKKIGIFIKPDPETRAKADDFTSWLLAEGHEVICKESLKLEKRPDCLDEAKLPEDLFCVFVLGGDGTFLSAVRWVGSREIPLLGVKFGEVGFLAEISAENLFEAAEAVLRNHFETHDRMRLQVRVMRNGRETGCGIVLNDLVINKTAIARLANIRTYIDDHYLTTYRADGLILATPTGSTAYSLAAGGPVIHPAVESIMMTPICPFTLTNRPLIVPDTVKIEIQVEARPTEIMATFDGQECLEIAETDRIIITKYDRPLRMITIPGHNYYDLLKAKLRWSGGRG